MKIIADLGKCDGIGMCESLCPDVFEVGPDGKVIVHHDQVDGREDEIREAIDSCPTSSLTVQA